MNTTSPPASCEQLLADVAAAFAEGDAADCARALAAALRPLAPAAHVSFASLADGAAAALDSAGKDRSDWIPSLRDALRVGGQKEQPLPAPLNLPAARLLARSIEGGGWLALAVAGDSSPEITQAVHTGLAVAAAVTALHLRLRTQRQELAAEAAKADIGEMAGPLIHEVTNLLNNLMLNLMLLEEGVEDPPAVNVAKIRQHTEQLTGMIKEIQEYCRRQSADASLVDVNRTVEQAVTIVRQEFPDLVAGAGPLSVELADDLPAFRGQRPDVVRCGVFLLKSAMQAAQAGRSKVYVRTQPIEGGSALTMELPGVHVPDQSPARLFDFLPTLCPTVSFLDLATCKSIARRFGGRLRAECPAGSSLMITLEISTAIV